MSPLKDILTKIRETSPSERDKGTTFERLIQFYLSNDPKYSFKAVCSPR